MTSPRHLWSGDWEQDSVASAEELERRRRERAENPPEWPEPEAARPEPSSVRSRPGAPAPTLAEQLGRALAAVGRALVAIIRGVGLLVLALLRGLRSAVAASWRALRRPERARLRLALVVVAAAAVVAVAAVALFSSGTSTPASAAQASPAALSFASRWLGVQFSMLPNGGVVIETVTPNGAAATEGLEPGDVVTQIDNQPIEGTADVARALQDLQSGSQVLIAVDRGSGTFTTSFPLPQRPAGGP